MLHSFRRRSLEQSRRTHWRGLSGFSSDEAEQMQGLTGGYVLHESLKQVGVKHVFGYSGGANLPILDAFHDSTIEFIMNRSEQCCGHAAEGYAKATGDVGVILTTSGPGLTNIITPLQDARGDSVPIVALSGQVPTGAVGTDAFQECNAVELTKPCTKWSYQIQSLEEVQAVVHEAFRVANSGKKGPVHLDLPKDIMTTILDGDLLPPPQMPEEPEADMEVIQRVADMINRARKPIIYAGQGAINAGLEVSELANKNSIPTTTTLHAMGIFDENNPLSLHMLGMHGAAYANFSIQNADLILAIGSRFDDRTTGNVASYAPKALKAQAEGKGGIIHFDIEKSQFGRVLEPTVRVEGDCKIALKDLLPLVEKSATRKANDPQLDAQRTSWLKQAALWKEEHPFRYEAPSDGKIKTQSAIEAVYEYGAKKSEKEVYVATGVGNHQMMACQFFRWTLPRSIITSGSLGTMGFGLPAAIGAQVGKPDATVLLIDGDGSFNMTLNDLGTIAEHKLPVKICLMNDGKQQMVNVWQKLFFDGRLVATHNHNPDFVMLAQSYGIEAFAVSQVDELQSGVERMMACEGPCLVEFKVEPDICLPMVAPGKALDDMILFGELSLEDEVEFEGMAPS